MPKLQVQPYEIEQMLILGEWGIADTEMLWHRFYRNDKSGNYCRFRLGLMRDAGFIQSYTATANCQRNTKRGSRSVPTKLSTIWQLTEVGADFVELETGSRPRRPARSDSVSAMTILHRLGVVKVRIAIDDAHRVLGLPKPTWIMEQDQYEGLEIKLTDPPHKKFVLYEAWGGGPTRVVCRPDSSVLITIPAADGHSSWSLAAYIEYDRSTETTHQVVSKCAGYATLLDPKTKYFRQHWPPAFDPKLNLDFGRVLFVCRSLERLQSIRNAVQNLPGAEYWRFAVVSGLTPPPKALTELVWQDVLGGHVAILPPRATLKTVDAGATS